MPRLHYVDHDFGLKALEVIRQANGIIADYAAQGYAHPKPPEELAPPAPDPRPPRPGTLPRARCMCDQPPIGDRSF